MDIAPATPEPVQLYELAAHTSDYNIYLADNLSLHTGILFERNKKVSFINISLAENVGKENEKVCFWKFQMQWPKKGNGVAGKGRDDLLVD